MTMNPDGTGQRAHYASGSFWPNRIFYARPIPDCPTKFVAIVTGHHGTARAGELVLFDVAKGRHQATGAVQRIPGRGKTGRSDHGRQSRRRVVAEVPAPVSAERQVLRGILPAQCRFAVGHLPGRRVRQHAAAPRGRRLRVVRAHSGAADAPPTRRFPDGLIWPAAKRTVYLQDIYVGSGLRGIPRGAVKKLRLFTYHFNYYGTSGIEDYVGMDGPWDVRRVLGTVPVAEDGSAYFTVPANTPIAVQPLDAEGKAVQLMRSWFTAMPGERVTCVGCHEHANNAPPTHAVATRRRGEPARITPWYGPVRGFSWDREVQPVLDRYCVAVTTARPSRRAAAAPDLRRAEPESMPCSPFPFPPSYYELRRFVRSPGLEGPSVIPVADYHADTNPLVQMLRKGHHNVQLDDESWDRLVTWIDMNAPAYGTWMEIPTVRNRRQYLQQPTDFFSNWLRPSPLEEIEHFRQRRMELLRRYGAVDDDPEAVPHRLCSIPWWPKCRHRTNLPAPIVAPADWPFDTAEAQRRQAGSGTTTTLTIEVGCGRAAGTCATSRPESSSSETSTGTPTNDRLDVVQTPRPFWIGACEVTNEQFRQFRPEHDSGSEPMLWLKWHPGHFAALNQPRQPVCRVSWEEANAFCQWLSQKTGRKFTLPDESQWEWACRAGTDTAWSFGEQAARLRRLRELRGRFAAWNSGVRRRWRRSSRSLRSSRSTTSRRCRRQWAPSSPIPGACTTCTATWPNGLPAATALSVSS